MAMFYSYVSHYQRVTQGVISTDFTFFLSKPLTSGLDTRLFGRTSVASRKMYPKKNPEEYLKFPKDVSKNQLIKQDSAVSFTSGTSLPMTIPGFDNWLAMTLFFGDVDT